MKTFKEDYFLKRYKNNIQFIRKEDNFINKIFESNNCGKFKVIGINKLLKDRICYPYYICEFIETGYQCLALASAIKRGSIKDNYIKSVFGIGYLGEYDGNKGKDPLYKTWVQMLSRCYNEKNPDYRKDCFVSKEWHCFYTFKNDCENLLGYKDMIDNPSIKYSLDKDFISQNNNIYSKEKCCFMPQDLNSFILNTRKDRDYKFEGVYYRKDCRTYRASIRYKGKTKHIIYSHDPRIAHEAYWNKKRNIAHEILNEKYSFVCEDIKTIIYDRLELKYHQSRHELEKAIDNGYFKRLEE